MAFIPIVTHTSANHPPSQEARELQQLLSHAVREYRSRHPDLSPAEVRQALELTRREVSPPPMGGQLIAIKLGLLSFLLGAGGFVWLARDRFASDGGPTYGLMAAVVGLLVVVMGVVAIARAGRS
jgi:hypothetical protein